MTGVVFCTGETPPHRGTFRWFPVPCTALLACTPAPEGIALGCNIKHITSANDQRKLRAVEKRQTTVDPGAPRLIFSRQYSFPLRGPCPWVAAIDSHRVPAARRRGWGRDAPPPRSRRHLAQGTLGSQPGWLPGCSRRPHRPPGGAPGRAERRPPPGRGLVGGGAERAERLPPAPGERVFPESRSRGAGAALGGSACLPTDPGLPRSTVPPAARDGALAGVIPSGRHPPSPGRVAASRTPSDPPRRRRTRSPFLLCVLPPPPAPRSRCRRLPSPLPEGRRRLPAGGWTLFVPLSPLSLLWTPRSHPAPARAGRAVPQAREGCRCKKPREPGHRWGSGRNV